MRSKVISLSLPTDIEKLIKALSEKLHMTKSQTIRLAITRLAETENIKPEAAAPQG